MTGDRKGPGHAFVSWLPRARLIAYVYPLLPVLLNLSTHTPQVRIYSVWLIFVHASFSLHIIHHRTEDRVYRL